MAQTFSLQKFFATQKQKPNHLDKNFVQKQNALQVSAKHNTKGGLTYSQRLRTIK